MTCIPQPVKASLQVRRQSGIRSRESEEFWGLGFRAWGLGFRVSGSKASEGFEAFREVRCFGPKAQELLGQHAQKRSKDLGPGG